VVGLAAGQALAQAPNNSARNTSAPDISAPARGTCGDARIGSVQTYNCLNRDLKDRVVQQRQATLGVTLDATSPAPAVGTFNQAAVREHLGSNFGKSAVPQRPPPPVYGSPLIPAR
jgi:hypothetical protein